MRLAVAALLTLFMLPAAAAESDWRLVGAPTLFEMGTGPAPGLAGVEAVYIKGLKRAQGGSLVQWGTIRRDFAAESWRGQRVSVTLRKREDDARVSIYFRISRPNGIVFDVRAKKTPTASNGWQDYRFVTDVPADATGFFILASLKDKGAGWVEGINFEAAGADVAVTGGRRLAEGPLFTSWEFRN